MSGQKSWDQMTPTEKAEQLKRDMDRFINHQNAVNGGVANRLAKIEELLAKIGNPQAKPGTP